MNSTVKEVLEFVKENDVKFVRLGFCDLFGIQKNISIMADELPSAFENGVSFDGNAIRGFGDAARSDLFLFPDPATLTVLPWRPSPGIVVRFYCDIRNPDGTPFPCDGRYLLKKVVARAEAMGYLCRVGSECEFYLFETNEKGEPTYTTLDKGGYLDISPTDKGDNMRREICLTLEEMGIRPETSHHEQGPGQNEIDFKFGDALSSADNLLTFKSVVKAVAARNGLYASFLPKPLPNAPGSGLHINLSLAKNGYNIFKNASPTEHSHIAESFIAGILEKAPEMTLFLNPLIGSYDRLGSYEAPRYVSWSHQNRSQLIRIPAAMGEKVRMELRSPDPSCNPYLAFALILAAGLDGIESGLTLPSPVDINLFTADSSVTRELASLPDSLSEAVALTRNSEFVKRVVGEDLLAKYLELDEADIAAFAAASDKAQYSYQRYFCYI